MDALASLPIARDETSAPAASTAAATAPTATTYSGFAAVTTCVTATKHLFGIAVFLFCFVFPIPFMHFFSLRSTCRKDFAFWCHRDHSSCYFVSQTETVDITLNDYDRLKAFVKEEATTFNQKRAENPFNQKRSENSFIKEVQTPVHETVNSEGAC